VPSHALPNNQKSQKLGTAVPAVARPCHQLPGQPPNTSKLARPCLTQALKNLIFPSSSIILQQQHLSSLKPLSKNSITTKTFKPSYLPQIYTKSQNFFTQTIPYITPNIIHQSKTTFIHPHQNSPKTLFPNLTPTNSSPTYTIQPINLTNTPTP